MVNYAELNKKVFKEVQTKIYGNCGVSSDALSLHGDFRLIRVKAK